MAAVASDLESTLSDFSNLFLTQTHGVFPKALSYIRGLFKSEKNRANCTAISDALAEMGHQNLNHLLNNSPWDYELVLSALSQKADQCFSNEQDVGLLIDEVGFRKKGRHSACVGRQYLGCIGKHDNGQVAVVAGLSSQHHYCPVDVRLFMPESWQEDTVRREKAKIPPNIVHQTKPQIALEMIRRIRDQGIGFDYTVFDTLYGISTAFITALDQEAIPFIGDVKDNMLIYTTPPVFAIPKREKGQLGPPYKHCNADRPTIKLRDYLSSLGSKDFQPIAFRDGAKQKIKAYFHRKEIWVSTDRKKGKTLRLQLLIRKNSDGTLKYSFSNMHEVSLETMAIRQGQRVFVERIFEEGKNQLGMGDYQVRTWTAFHKHITLCFMAFYFVHVQKVRYHHQIKLTTAVIRKLVASTIVSKWQSLDSTIQLCITQLQQYQLQIRRNLNNDWVT